MATDNNGLTDELVVELNPAPSSTPAASVERIPERPSEKAPAAKWVAYLVAHGADRTFLESETRHWSGGLDDGEYVTSPAYTRKQLVELAEQMGV